MFLYWSTKDWQCKVWRIICKKSIQLRKLKLCFYLSQNGSRSGVRNFKDSHHGGLLHFFLIKMINLFKRLNMFTTRTKKTESNGKSETSSQTICVNVFWDQSLKDLSMRISSGTKNSMWGKNAIWKSLLLSWGVSRKAVKPYWRSTLPLH